MKLVWKILIILLLILIIGLLLYYFISGEGYTLNNPNGYFKHLPSIQIHPDNKKELIQVKKAVNSRTKPDELFFKLSDVTLYKPFQILLQKNGYNYSKKQLNYILNQPHDTIMKLKRKYNRIRPYQLNKNLNILKTNTANTPAYPAGHAYQSYYLAKYLYTKHPELKHKLIKLSDNIDRVRVIAGLHYPSDGLFARKLVLGY